MSAGKPFIDQMSDMAKGAGASFSNGNARDNAKKAIYGMGDSVSSMGESVRDMKTGIINSIGDFSKKTVTDASSEFLDSNSLLAKFSFILLVLVVFVISLKVLMSFVGYLTGPNANPYIVVGLLNGNQTVTISQDPSNTSSIPLLRSNDRNKGIEFTYNTWLILDEPPVTATCKNIFVKGDNIFDTSYCLTNGPGLYVRTDLSGTMSYSLEVCMDTIDSNSKENVIIPNIPIKKWMNIAIRVQNLTLDVYVNGTIAKRLNLTKIPKQNSSDVIVCGNGGFVGSISNLRYHSYALSVFEINNIVRGGPSLSTSSFSSPPAASGTSSYLANSWYNNNY